MSYSFFTFDNSCFYYLRHLDKKQELYVLEAGNIHIREKGNRAIYSDANLLHFITGGSGTVNGCPVKEGDVFVIHAGQIYREAGDYTQYWIKFGGHEADAMIDSMGCDRGSSTLTPSPEIFELIASHFRELFEIDKSKVKIEFYLKGLLYKIFSLLTEEKEESPMPSPIMQVKEYIKKNYTEDIDLQKMAELVHLSPKYLSRIFSGACGKTITKYLQSVRINNAQRLLLTTNMNIGEIARAVGCHDPLYFSKTFKRQCGCSPRQWKQSHAQ